ncbi:MAG TPA: AAA family ATPase [Nocardioidaceae bacterium]|nr:AAA family ATPase [Nocardioidaceae bacterium]
MSADRSAPDAQVVILCGIAGSGKTTYAQLLEARGYLRLSVDEEIWRRFGRYGVDYPEHEYDALSAQVQRSLDERLVELVRDGRRVVVDRSMWQRSQRDRAKQLVESAGGTWQLVYLRAGHEVLRARLRERSRRFDANAAFPVSVEVLDHYLAVFEPPEGEGEVVTEVPAMVRCVGAIVRDAAGRLLLIQRGQPPAQGTWSLPGGRVEAGESDAAAVAREVREETGLSVQPGEQVGRVERDGPGGVVYEIYDYAATVMGGTLAAATDATDARWAGPAELLRLPCAPGLVRTLRDWDQLR